MTCYKYSITCQDDLLTVDNAQSHVTAFRPVSEAACSWSDDNVMCQLGQQTQEIQSRDRQLSESAHQMVSLRANGSAYVLNTGLCVTLLVGRQEGHPACKK